MSIDVDEGVLVLRYVLSRMIKRELQRICKEKDLPKSGTKLAIINRLLESCTIQELLINTEKNRQSIGKYLLDSELLELRLSLGSKYKEYFFVDPLQALGWCHKLFIAILLRGPMRKSEIINDKLFQAFLSEFDGDPNDKRELCKEIMRLSRRILVSRDIVLIKSKKYCIHPGFHEYFQQLSGTTADQLALSFMKSWSGKHWLRKHNLSPTTPKLIDLQPVKFSKKKPVTISPNEVTDSIRLLAFSDWRVQSIDSVFQLVKSVKPVDFILYAGDDIGRFEEEGINYFTELSHYTRSKQVLVVIGNDDNYFQKTLLKRLGVHDLYNQSYFYKNFAFVGLEASTSGPALFRHEEQDFEQHLRHQSKVVDNRRLVILSHTPPYGVLDRGIRFAKLGEGTHHIGSTALRHFIETNPLDLVICGHCHSQGGMIEQCEKVMVANVSSHDNPGAKGNFVIIELFKDGIINIEWHDTTEMLDKESLRQIYGIGLVRSEMFAACGIPNLTQLAECSNLVELAQKSKLSEKHLKLLQLRAKSILNRENYQIKSFDIPSGKTIFFDIETDIACERVWLIGILIDGNFTQLYADDWEQEKEVLTNFTAILEKYPNYVLMSYSGTNFDYRVVFHAIQRHGINTDLLSSHRHIDLCVLLSRCFIFPNQRFALKELGTFLNYPFSHSDLDGLAVALSYHRHTEDNKPLNPKIFKYNEDDVKSLPFIIQRVTKGDLTIKKVLLASARVGSIDLEREQNIIATL